MFAASTAFCCHLAHADNSIELEVLGALSTSAYLERGPEDLLALRGKLKNEEGVPLQGLVHLEHENSGPLLYRPCPNLRDPTSPTEPRRTNPIQVDKSGAYCAWVEGENSSLRIRASSPHYITQQLNVVLPQDSPPPAPTIVGAPTNVVLGANSPTTIEILTAPNEHARPKAHILELNVHCNQKSVYSSTRDVKGSRLTRFEIHLPLEVPHGHCRLSARVHSGETSSATATQDLWLQRPVNLVLQSEEVLSNNIIEYSFKLEAHQETINSGLIEARSEGVFLAGVPVSGGRASLELKTGKRDKSVQFIFVPSSPALVAGSGVDLVLPAATPEKSWTPLHVFGLIAFALWLGWVWLRPQSKPPTSHSSPPPVRPPRVAKVSQSGEKKGPIAGKIVDAHTGAPVGDVLITLGRHTVHQENTFVESVRSSENGGYQLNAQFVSSGFFHLKLKSSRHMEMHCSVDASFQTIHIASRRRTILGNLLKWCHSVGTPWLKQPQVTPEELQKLAQAHSAPSVEQWAREICRTAYALPEPGEKTVESLKIPSPPAVRPKNS